MICSGNKKEWLLFFLPEIYYCWIHIIIFIYYRIVKTCRPVIPLKMENPLSPEFIEILIRYESYVLFLKRYKYTYKIMINEIIEKNGMKLDSAVLARANNKRKRPEIRISEDVVIGLNREIRRHLLYGEREEQADEFYLEYKNEQTGRDDFPKIFLDTMPEATIYSNIEAASKYIKILETNIYNAIRVFGAIEKALVSNPDLQVEVLLLWPESEIAHFRNKVIFPVEISEMVYKNLETLAGIVKETNAFERVTVKFYNQIPLVSIFDIDGELYNGFYWAHTSTITGPWLNFPADFHYPLTLQNLKLIRTNIENHYRKLWDQTELKVDLLDFRTSIKEYRDKHVPKESTPSPPEVARMNELYGDYILYFIDSKSHKLVSTQLFVDQKGEVRIERESNLLHLSGSFSPITDNRYFKLSASNKSGSLEYYGYFRLYSKKVLKGVYCGVETSMVNGGRAIAIKKSHHREAEGFSKPLKFEWNEKLIKRLLNDEHGIIEFMSGSTASRLNGQNNYILDNPGKFGITPSTQWLGIGDPLKSIEGTYSMYYLSSSKGRMIRKYVFHFSKKGNVKVKEMDPGRKKLEGLAIRYRANLTARLFRKGRPEETVWFLTALLQNSTRLKSFIGILAGFPAYDSSIGRRAFFQWEDQTFENVEPQKFPIGSTDFFELENRFPGLCNWLTDRSNNYSLAPINVASSFRNNNSVCNSLFRSSCFLVTKGEGFYNQALTEFKEAVIHGYSNQEEFDYEIKNTLRPIQEPIQAILNERGDYLIAYASSV